MRQTVSNKNTLVPAVVLTAHVMGYGVIRALGQQGVPIDVFYYDERDVGQFSRYVRRRVKAPHPEFYEDAFVRFLMETADPKQKCLLIPADDACLQAVSKHKTELEAVYIVAGTDWDITEKFLDKQYTYRLAEELGIPSPKTRVIQQAEDINALNGKIQYPCVVKPCMSHGYFELFGKKMVYAENCEKAVEAFLQAHEADFDVMLQEYIPGGEDSGINYNSYMWDGRITAEFTAEKVRSATAEYYIPRVVKSKQINEILAPSRQLLQVLGFYGYSCMEYKKDARDGVYKFMEINGRFNRSSMLAVQCGLNFAWIAYQDLVYGNILKSKQVSREVYWIDLIPDIFKSIRFYRQERFSFRQYLKPYLSPHVFAVFDRNDMKPFIMRCLEIMRRACVRPFLFMSNRINGNK